MKKSLKLFIAYSLGLLSAWIFMTSNSKSAATGAADREEDSRSRQVRDESSKGSGRKSDRVPRFELGSSSEEIADQVRLAFNSSDSMVRQMAFSRLLAEANAGNIADIRAVFLEFDRSGLRYDREWHMMWHQWGTLDPQAALDQLNKEIANGGNYGMEPLMRIFSAWGLKDPDAAYEALQTLDNPREFDASYLGMVNGMPLDVATRFAEQTDFDRRSFSSKVAENLADRKLRETNSISELKTWYEGLDGSFQNASLNHVYWRIRTADFEDAASWINSQALAGAPVKRIAAEMTDVYLSRKDFSGLNWYLDLPAEVQNSGKLANWYEAIDTNSPSWKEWSNANPEVVLKLEEASKNE